MFLENMFTYEKALPGLKKSYVLGTTYYSPYHETGREGPAHNFRTPNLDQNFAPERGGRVQGLNGGESFLQRASSTPP